MAVFVHLPKEFDLAVNACMHSFTEPAGVGGPRI